MSFLSETDSSKNVQPLYTLDGGLEMTGERINKQTYQRTFMLQSSFRTDIEENIT